MPRRRNDAQATALNATPMLRIPITAIRGFSAIVSSSECDLARVQCVVGKALLHGDLVMGLPPGVAPYAARSAKVNLSAR